MEAVSKELAKEVSAEISAAVTEILKKHNLIFTKQTTKFGDEFGYTMGATAVKLNEDGINLLSSDVIAYQRNGYMGQIKKVDGSLDFVELTAKIGQKFAVQGKTYSFAGVLSRGKLKIIGVETVSKQASVFADTIIHKLNAKS